MTSGKVRVIVKSQKVPSGTFELATPEFAPSGILLGMRKRNIVLYDFVLDDEQRKALEEGYKLSRTLGLNLEVVDRTRSGVRGRVLSSLGRLGPSGPTLVIAPAVPEKGIAKKLGLAPV